MNTYSYVYNNPLRYTDPRGLDGFPGMGDPFPGMGDPLEGVIDQMNNIIQQPTPDTRCARCFIDFANPIPDVVSEKAAEKTLGEVSSQVVKKANKIIGAYDLAKCLRRCRDDDENCK